MLNRKSSKIMLTAGLLLAVSFFIPIILSAQVKWINVDADYAPLPSTVQVFKTTDSLDRIPFLAYYVKAKLKDKQLEFTTDTTHGRQLTPLQFYDKNNKPLVVVNTTFFSFETNQNLNVVIKKGKLVGYNIHTIPMKGKDTFQYKHPFGSAIGISEKRAADVAWLYTDSSGKFPYASQRSLMPMKDSMNYFQYFIKKMTYSYLHSKKSTRYFKKWKMQTAVGGGPVLVQNGKIEISNEEELKFTGKAINDKHP